MSEKNEILEEEEEEEEGENIPNIRQEPEKIIPPTFYEKVGDNLSMDLPKLIYIVTARYKLLKDVEYFSRRKSMFYKIIHKKIPLDLTWTNEETINNDIASHFLLALIMSQNPQELRWFIQQESLLYYARIRRPKYGTPKFDMYKILISLGMKLNIFDPNQNQDIDINKIRFRRKNKINEKIYYINFFEGLNLIPQRAYYLHKGNLYILENDLGKLFFRIFQKKQYDIISKIRSKAEEIKKDKRIKEIIISYEKEKEKYNFQQAIKITKEVSNNHKLKTMYDVDLYSEKCFPLCMCAIQRHINKYSHLMHLGRVQYTLFLKGAGLPVEEALKFYQKKYEKKCSLEKFNKQYAYYIRYSYGLEGKKANYMPFNCDKIISFNAPMGGECHGCPFKNYSADELRKVLSTCDLRDIDIEDIMNKKKNKEYKFCCVRYFKGKFIGSNGEGIGIHPNKYFSLAMKILKGESKNNSQKTDVKDSTIKKDNKNSDDINMENNKIGVNNDNNNYDIDINLDDINIKNFNDIEQDDENSDDDSDKDNKMYNKNDSDIDNNINNKEEKKEDNDDDEDKELDIDLDNLDFFDDIQ